MAPSSAEGARSEPKASEARGKRVFILGGGAALGAHQVGAMKLLEQEGIRPDAIVGSSIGVVNAPALMQRVLARCAHARCDVDFYRRNRDLLCNGLRKAGYDFAWPGGGMFAFPRTPGDDP